MIVSPPLNNITHEIYCRIGLILLRHIRPCFQAYQGIHICRLSYIEPYKIELLTVRFEKTGEELFLYTAAFIALRRKEIKHVRLVGCIDGR